MIEKVERWAHLGLTACSPADLHVGRVADAHQQFTATAARFGQTFAGEPHDFAARHFWENLDAPAHPGLAACSVPT